MSVDIEAVLPKEYETEISVVAPQGGGTGAGVSRDEFNLLDEKVDDEIKRAKDAERELQKQIDGLPTIGGGSYTLPVATADVLGGVKSYTNRGYIGESPAGREYVINVNGDGFASVTIPVGEEVDGDSDEPVSGKAVANYVADAIDTPVVNHTETTVEIAPNVLNLWGEVAELDITLAEGKAGVVNEYIIQFTSGETPTVLALPSEIKWWNDKIPVIAENMTYQISILNGLAVFLYFKNSTT